MNKTALAYLLHVFLPLLAGGLIYLAFRSEILPVCAWAMKFDPTGGIENWRHWAQTDLRPHVPDWLIFNLPAGLWAYSITLFFWLAWKAQPQGAVWRWIGWVAAVGAEALQGVGILTGTFSWLDLAFILAACFAGWLVGKRMFPAGNPGTIALAGSEENTPSVLPR